VRFGTRRSVLLAAVLVLLSSVMAACGGGGNAPAPAVDSASPYAPLSGGPIFGQAPPTGSPVPDAVAAVLALVAAAPTISKLPPDLTPALEDVAKDGDLIRARDQGCSLQSSQDTSPDCVYGDMSGAHTMVLFGDSHMAQWLSAFEVIAKRLHWRVILLSKEQCPSVYVSVYDDQEKRAFPECDRWRDNAIKRINSTAPDLVVITNRTDSHLGPDQRQISAATWIAGLEKTLSLITVPNDHKVVLSDTPVMPDNPSECLAAHQSNVQGCSRPLNERLLGHFNLQESTTASRLGVAYVDVVPLLCGRVCTYVVGNMVVYWDGGHLTSTYSRYLSDAVQALLGRFLGGT
jgi:hypothetical protein